MFLDTATLQDLEIVPTQGRRGPTLWSMVDRTRTRAGAQALRQRLLAPPDTADEIVALQQAHRMLAEGDGYRSLLDRADLNGVEEYFAATWQLPDSMPGLARLRTWYRQYLHDAVQGQRRVAGLLATARAVADRLLTSRVARLRNWATTL